MSSKNYVTHDESFNSFCIFLMTIHLLLHNIHRIHVIYTFILTVLTVNDEIKFCVLGILCSVVQ